MVFHVRKRPVGDEFGERFEGALKRQWEEGKYCKARKGDHLLTPFECYRCIFMKLKGRCLIVDAPKDKLLLGAIRRINLDTF